MRRWLNRAATLLLGLALTAVGAWVLLAAAGQLDAVGLPRPSRPGAWYRSVADTVGDRPDLWLAGIAVGGVLLALLGLWLAFGQLRPAPVHRRRDIDIHRTLAGTTTLRAGAVSRAVARDLTSIRGVQGASVTTRRLGDPLLEVTIELASDVDVGDVRPALEAAYERTRTALNVEHLAVRARFDFTDEPTSRVV